MILVCFTIIKLPSPRDKSITVDNKKTISAKKDGDKDAEIERLTKLCDQQAKKIKRLVEKQFNYENILARIPSHVDRKSVV